MKCREHSPAARAFYISLVFSNACRVLSQCKTRLRLLYLLNKYLLLTEFEVRTVTYGTDREDEVSEIFSISLLCV